MKKSSILAWLILSCAALPGQAFAEASLIFTNTGDLDQGRGYHTATLLPGGKVLVAGGLSGDFANDGAELYDPATGTWTATENFAVSGRYGHTATLLPNEEVLVAGGSDGPTQLASAELCDPASGIWAATGNLTTARMSHTATLLPNGKVLIAAGINSGNDPEASAELYDPATGKWTATGSLATGRFFHTATLLLNGKVLVAGGGSPGTSAELFDPASGTWAATGNLTTPRVRHTATLLSSGKVLVTGGSDGPTNTAELYDPATGKWTATGSLAIGRYFHTATLLPDGNVLVAGGNGADTSAELYDVAKGTWPATGTLNRTHTQHTATLLSNGSVLIAGSGDGDLADTKSAELYSTGQPIPSQLLNIATRLRVQTGENVLIGGFIITGTEPKKAIIRGIGPSLSSFFSGVLANPTLELHQGNTLLAVNDDWTEKRTEIEATGLQPSNNLESTIVRTLAPGNYTAIVRGKNGTTGIGVVEAYDLNQAAKSKLANLATRGFVETGDNVMIGGLIVGPQGAANTKVVVRAIGPSLSKFGINGALQNPTLDLVNSSGAVIRSNDNWKLTQRTEIEALNLQPSDDRESALVQTLAPGNYTAIVRGAGNTTGVGLVEVYNVE